ncbi:13484_t:CDS:2, partial [Acaulospora morrowiae]
LCVRRLSKTRFSQESSSCEVHTLLVRDLGHESSTAMTFFRAAIARKIYQSSDTNMASSMFRHDREIIHIKTQKVCGLTLSGSNILLGQNDISGVSSERIILDETRDSNNISSIAISMRTFALFIPPLSHDLDKTHTIYDLMNSEILIWSLIGGSFVNGVQQNVSLTHRYIPLDSGTAREYGRCNEVRGTILITVIFRWIWDAQFIDSFSK